MTDPDARRRAPTSSRSRPSSSRRSSRASGPTRCCPRVGGQTALNLARATWPKRGTLERHGVELIGADSRRSRRRRGPAALPAGDGVDRHRRCRGAHRASLGRGARLLAEIGYPAILRPSFTLGGTGGGVAHDGREFRQVVAQACTTRPVGNVLVEQSAAGLEGVRARGDARPQRQRRHRLLDRERRPDGRPHGRHDHRGPGTDADGQGVPAPARLRHRDHRARSASTPAGPTSSSPSTPRTAR